MAIFIPGLISVAAGVVLALLRTRPSHERRLVKLLAGIAIWLLLTVFGPADEAVQIPVWQVVSGHALSVRFDLNLWQWVWLQVFSSVYLIHLLHSAQDPADDRQAVLRFVALGIFLLAAAAANDLARILLWLLLDILLALWRNVQRKDILPSLLLGIASVLLLMTGSVLSMLAGNAAGAEGVFSDGSRSLVILVAALLRLMSGFAGKTKENSLQETGTGNLLALLSGGLVVALLVQEAPIAAVSRPWVLLFACVGLLLQIEAFFRPNDASQDVHPCYGQLLVLLCIGIAQPPETQTTILAAGASLWLILSAFDGFPPFRVPWWRWFVLLFPLVLAGLPYSPGGLFVAALLTVQQALIVLIIGGMSLLLASAGAWRRWQHLRREEIKSLDGVIVLDYVAAVVWISAILYPVLRAGASFSPASAIVFAILTMASALILVLGDRMPAWDWTPQRVTPFVFRTRVLLGRLMGGVRTAYSYAVDLASDILEGDGGTLWIIVVVLMALLGLRNVSP